MKKAPASETEEEIPMSMSFTPPMTKERNNTISKDLPSPRRVGEMYQRDKTTRTPCRIEEMYQRGKNQKRIELHQLMETKRKRLKVSVLRPINKQILDEKSSRLNDLYEKGKKQNRADLETFLRKKNARKYLFVDKKHMKLEKPKATTPEMIAYNKRMFDLRKKNHDIAVKRRMQIARARSRVSLSLPFQTSSGDSSSLSSSTSSVISSISMFEMREKNREFVIKRKIQIARARARRALVSLPFDTQVSKNDDTSSISISSDISSMSMFEMRPIHPVIEIKRKIQKRRGITRASKSLPDDVLVVDTTEDTSSMSSSISNISKTSSKSSTVACSPQLVELYNKGKHKQQEREKSRVTDDNTNDSKSLSNYNTKTTTISNAVSKEAPTKSNFECSPRLTELYNKGKDKQRGKQKPSNNDDEPTNQDESRTDNTSPRSIDSAFFEKLMASKKDLSPRSNMILAMGSNSTFHKLDLSTA
jgi:hypothetical protein